MSNSWPKHTLSNVPYPNTKVVYSELHIFLGHRIPRLSENDLHQFLGSYAWFLAVGIFRFVIVADVTASTQPTPHAVVCDHFLHLELSWANDSILLSDTYSQET